MPVNRRLFWGKNELNSCGHRNRRLFYIKTDGCFLCQENFNFGTNFKAPTPFNIRISSFKGLHFCFCFPPFPISNQTKTLLFKFSQNSINGSTKNQKISCFFLHERVECWSMAMECRGKGSVRKDEQIQLLWRGIREICGVRSIPASRDRLLQRSLLATQLYGK